MDRPDQEREALQGEITRILSEVRAKTPGAVDTLIETVRDDLRSRAERQLSHAPPWRTLDPTALVHEVYLRLFGGETQQWEDRGHFFMAASRAMHDVLVERARRATRLKRGGDHQRVPLTDDMGAERDAATALELDELLSRLEELSPRRADIVRMRFYAGLTESEIAQYLGVSGPTIRREWAKARAWLIVKLQHSSEDSGHSG